MVAGSLEQSPGNVVVPGNYDGVHLGHRALLQAAHGVAGAGAAVVAFTFDPHPACVLRPEHAPRLLTTRARRIELLTLLGADKVHVETFDRPFSQRSPEAFVRGVLVDKLHAHAMVVGRDFRFGAQRAGDVALLRRFGQRYGFRVVLVPHRQTEGQAISSSRVRTAVEAGEVERAAHMLGRFHDVCGTVVRGDQRGRSIGFPTANLEPESVLLPADGVYAVVGRVLGAETNRVLRGVANLGQRPTFGAGRSLEAHMLDFDGDLYGQQVRVGFVARLRPEQQFGSVAALRAQILRDVAAGRAALQRLDKEQLSWL